MAVQLCRFRSDRQQRRQSNAGPPRAGAEHAANADTERDVEQDVGDDVRQLDGPAYKRKPSDRAPVGMILEAAPGHDQPHVKHTSRLLLCSLIVIGFAVQAGAGTVANSITEFPSVQGQDHWFYGIYAQGAVGGLPHGYSTGAFVPFETFAGARWEASDAQVGANDNDFLSVSDIGWHPDGLDLGQTNLIWAIRRYQSEVDALVDIAFDLRKINVAEPRGGGGGDGPYLHRRRRSGDSMHRQRRRDWRAGPPHLSSGVGFGAGLRD